MNEVLEKYQQSLLNDYFYEKEYITDEEYKRITSEEKSFTSEGYTYDASAGKY